MRQQALGPTLYRDDSTKRWHNTQFNNFACPAALYVKYGIALCIFLLSSGAPAPHATRIRTCYTYVHASFNEGMCTQQYNEQQCCRHFLQDQKDENIRIINDLFITSLFIRTNKWFRQLYKSNLSCTASAFYIYNLGVNIPDNPVLFEILVIIFVNCCNLCLIKFYHNSHILKII